MNEDLVGLEGREPSDYGGGALWPDEAADLFAKLRGLRAILAPLLDDPFRSWEKGWVICPLCLVQHTDEWNFPHVADCPVLRRDALLGRV